MQAWLWGTCESPSTALLSMTSHSTTANIPKQKPDLYKQEESYSCSSTNFHRRPGFPKRRSAWGSEGLVKSAKDCLKERKTSQNRQSKQTPTAAQTVWRSEDLTGERSKGPFEAPKDQSKITRVVRRIALALTLDYRVSAEHCTVSIKTKWYIGEGHGIRGRYAAFLDECR